MVVSWPKRITAEKGGLRSSFLHLIDIAPTILDAAGIPQPQVVNGVRRSRSKASASFHFRLRTAPEVRTVSTSR
jgi:arylsulfatase